MPTIGGSPPVVGPLPFPQSGYMPSAGNAPYLHRAIAQTIAGSGAADRKLLLMGDSIAAGSLNGGANNIVGIGPTAELVNYLIGEGTPAAEGLSVAQPNTSSGLSLDVRWVNGAGWTIPATGNGNAGLHNLWGGIGPCWQGAPAAATLTFTPAAGTPNYDSFDVYYFNAGVASGFSVNFNGGANTVVSQSVLGLYKTTVSGASTSRPTCNFSTVTGAFGCQVVAVEPFLSTTRRLRVGNAGVLGTTSGQWVDNTSPATGPIASLQQYAPDIVIYSMQWNDLNGNVPVSTFLSNMGTMIAAVKALPADIIVHIETPFLSTFGNGTQQTAFAAALIAYCRSNGIAYVDTFDAWGGAANFANLNALGYYNDNTIHPSIFGDYDIGRLMGQALIQI